MLKNSLTVVLSYNTLIVDGIVETLIYDPGNFLVTFL
jgi:hypothetical protein